MLNHDINSQSAFDNLVETLIEKTRAVDAVVRKEALSQLCELGWNDAYDLSMATDTFLFFLADADEDMAESATYGLSHCFPTSFAPVRRLLTNENAILRARACETLSHIGEAAIVSSKEVCSLLADPNQLVRKKAAFALGLMRDTDDETICALFLMADSNDLAEISSALHALGNIGSYVIDKSSYRERAEFLLNKARNGDEDIRWSACYALESAALPVNEYINFLVERILEDDEMRVQSSCACTLYKYASIIDLSIHLPALIKMLDEKKAGISYICSLLANRKQDATKAAPAVKNLMLSSTTIDAIQACVTYWELTRDITPVIPLLTNLLENYPETVSDAVCQIGPAALPLLPELIKIFEIDDWDCHWAATDAISALVHDNPVVIETLLMSLTHNSPIIKSSAINGLVKIGASSVKPLINMLVADAPHAAWAATALGKIGTAASEATPILYELMQLRQDVLGQSCAIAYAMITGDPVADSFLEKLVRSDMPWVRRDAIVAAMSLKKTSATLEKLIADATHDEVEEVRDAATQYLQMRNHVLH